MRSSRAAIAELEQKGLLEEALAICEDALERNPEQKDLLRSRASLLARLDRKGEAILLYQKLAQVYAQEGRPVQALAHLAEIHPLEETTSSAYEAAASLRQALDATPSREIVLPEFFRHLEAPLIAALLERMERLSVEDGAIVIKQGEAGEHFYLLVEGQLRLLREKDGKTEAIGRLHEGQGFGEIALLTPLLRTVTVVSEGSSRLLRFSRLDLEDVGKTYPLLLREMRSFATDRLFSNLFAACPLFQPLKRTEQWALSAHFELLPFTAFETPLAEGHPSEGLSIVAGGRLALYKTLPDGEQGWIEDLFIGSFFGEDGLLSAPSEAISSFSVVASEASLLVKINGDDLPWILDEYPAFREALHAVALKRQRLAEERLRG